MNNTRKDVANDPAAIVERLEGCGNGVSCDDRLAYDDSVLDEEESRTYIVTEYCPHCESEVEIHGWNTERDGYQAFCPYCGEVLMLCDECHQEAGRDVCNYDTKTGTCFRCNNLRGSPQSTCSHNKSREYLKMRVMRYGEKDYFIEPMKQIDCKEVSYKLEWVTAVPSKCMFWKTHYEYNKLEWKPDARQPAIRVIYIDNNGNEHQEICFKRTKMPISEEELLNMLEERDQGYLDDDGWGPRTEDVLKSAKRIPTEVQQMFYDKMHKEFVKYEEELKLQPAEAILENAEKYSIFKKIMQILEEMNVDDLDLIYAFRGVTLDALTDTYYWSAKEGIKELKKLVRDYIAQMAKHT